MTMLYSRVKPITGTFIYMALNQRRTGRTQSPLQGLATTISNFPHQHAIAAIALAGVLALVLAIYPSEPVVAKKHEIAEIESQPLLDPVAIEEVITEPEIPWQTLAVEPGDTLHICSVAPA